MLNNFEPADFIAILVILGIIAMNFKGTTFMLPQAGLIILGYYFGHKAGRTKNPASPDSA